MSTGKRNTAWLKTHDFFYALTSSVRHGERLVVQNIMNQPVLSLLFHGTSNPHSDAQSVFTVDRYVGGVQHKHENLGIFTI